MIANTITVTTTPIVIVAPGTNFHAGYIQNTGANDLRISLDGLNNPTATAGMIIYSGSQLWLPDYITNPIRARAVTGTTTVEVGTDDTTSVAYPNTLGN